MQNGSSHAKKRDILFHLALIFIVSLCADLFYVGSYGLYSDDWHDSIEHLLADDETFVKNMNDMLIHQWEMRPLRTVEYALQRVVFSMAGLSGVYVLQALIIAFSMLVLYLILIERLHKNHALLITLIFSLSPLDTTTLWLATMHHRFCLLFCFLAMYSLLRGRHVIFSALCLMISLLFSELAFGIFLLTPLLMIEFSENRHINKKIFYPILKKTLLLFISVFVIYMIWRIIIAPLYMKDMRVEEFLAGGLLGYIKRYADCFKYGYQILFISGLKFLAFSMRSDIFIFVGTIVVFSIISLIYFKYKKNNPPVKTKPHEDLPNSWFHILYYIGLGLITVPLSYWYGICYKSCLYMGGLTRFNFPNGIAYAFFLFGIILLLFKAIEHFFKSSKLIFFSKTFILIIAFSLLMTHRIHIQKDYAENWQIQKNVITDMFTLFPALPENTLIILNYRDASYRPMFTFKKDKFWQTDAIAELLYGPKRGLILMDDINQIDVNEDTIKIKAWDEMGWWVKEFSLSTDEIIFLNSSQKGRLSREDTLRFETESHESISIAVNNSNFTSNTQFTGDAKFLSFLGIPIERSLVPEN